jgi:hypothetical protein
MSQTTETSEMSDTELMAALISLQGRGSTATG